MKKNIVYGFFIFTILVSCVDRNTGYRLVGKNGRVIYLEKKRPAFNQEKLKEKEQIKKQNNRIQQLDNETNKKITRINGDSKIEDNLLLDSNAYSLKSVIDTMIDNKDINTLAKMVEKKQRPKTIRDFKIPESYFNSNKVTRETIASNQINNKNIVNNNKEINLNNNSNVLSFNKNEQKAKKKESIFDMLFGHKKENKSQKSIELNNKITNTSPDIVTQNKITTIKQNTANNLITKNSIDNDIIKKNESIKNEFFNETLTKKSTDTEKKKNVLFTTQNQVNKKIKSNDTLIKNKYYIQLGSYSDLKKAYKMVNDYNLTENEKIIVPITLDNKKMYRAIIGTFNTKTEAEKIMEKIIEKGHFDVFVFKK